MFVRPSSVSVPYGTRVVLHVVNHGAISHDLQLDGGSTGTGMLSPGQARTVSYGVFGRTGQAWCTVPGHKAAGMILTITVTGSAASAASAHRDAVISRAAAPPPGWHAVDSALAPAPSGTVHRVTLVAEDKEMQVAPGVTQDMWTFGGQVPGPTLRGHGGDEFIVTLINHTDMDHSLDFHAASEPMQAMREVAPGRSVTYEFRARYAGIYLYHCGTPPVLEHLANGMFGAVIIDPPRLPPVPREFLVVQSELYLGPQGQPGDYAKMLRGQPDAVAFNPYAGQYLYAPLHVRAGQRIRIWVLDAGPSDDSSFHVVGAQFDTVFNNGAYLLRPGNPADGAAQTLDLMPGEGGYAEFTVPAAGQYEMLDHPSITLPPGRPGTSWPARRDRIRPLPSPPGLSERSLPGANGVPDVCDGHWAGVRDLGRADRGRAAPAPPSASRVTLGGSRPGTFRVARRPFYGRRKVHSADVNLARASSRAACSSASVSPPSVRP